MAYRVRLGSCYEIEFLYFGRLLQSPLSKFISTIFAEITKLNIFKKRVISKGFKRGVVNVFENRTVFPEISFCELC
jgi:hypothetical protein